MHGGSGSSPCRQPVFRRDLCREHFCAYARSLMGNTFASIHKSPERSFGAMDFEGRGYLTLDMFLKSSIM